MKQVDLPVYLDGGFDLYKITKASKGDFKYDTLVSQNLSIAYREMALYDTLRIELQKDDISPTYKIRIPRYREISTKCVLKIGDEYNRVVSVNHTTDRNGFLETEIITKGYEVTVND